VAMVSPFLSHKNKNKKIRREHGNCQTVEHGNETANFPLHPKKIQTTIFKCINQERKGKEQNSTSHVWKSN